MMRSKLKKCLTGIIIILLLLLNACSPAQEPETAGESLTNKNLTGQATTEFVTCPHFDEQLFGENKAKAQAYENLNSTLIGFTSPHYAPVMYLTASALQTAAQTGSYDTVVIAAPNHTGEGLPVIVGDVGLDTAFGRMSVDWELTKAILQSLGSAKCGANRERMLDDHSATTLVPYVKYYLPNVKIVTLLLSRGAQTADLEKITDCLWQAADTKKILLISSIDFSHYQDYNQTLKNDEETIKAITDEKWDYLKTWHGEHLDSPESFLALAFWTKKNAGHIDLQQHEVERDLPPNSHTGYSYMVWTATLH